MIHLHDFVIAITEMIEQMHILVREVFFLDNF